MAEPNPTPTPALGSTAEANPYVPVSWMAVAAELAAGLFVVLLLLFGYSAAFKDKKPLIMPSLLLVAGVGIVLSFAGRRMIRNSEGTRTGEHLTSSAWWICVVGGLGYAAYLFGIEYTIKSDAQAEVERWVNQIMDGSQPQIDAAFYRTLEPAARSVGSPEDLGELKRRFTDRYVAFGQMDVVRLAKRNPGLCRFQMGGMREWVTRPGMIECMFTGVVKCPEGSFPVEIPMRGVEGGGGEGGSIRQWEVAVTPTGLVKMKEIALTPYGWRVTGLESEAVEYAQAFIAGFRQGPSFLPWAYQAMVRPDGNVEFWGSMNLLARYPVWGELHRVLPQLAMTGRTWMAALALDPDYVAHPWDKLFRRPGGARATEDQEKTFLAAFQAGGLLPTGRSKGGLLPSNDQIDAHPLLNLTDSAVVVRVPCEIPVVGSGGEKAYRARVVVSCSQPELVAELKLLRDEADPDRATATPTSELRKGRNNWRVVAIESDLTPASAMAPPGGGNAPTPMPGPGAGGGR